MTNISQFEEWAEKGYIQLNEGTWETAMPVEAFYRRCRDGRACGYVDIGAGVEIEYVLNEEFERVEFERTGIFTPDEDGWLCDIQLRPLK